MFLKRPPCDADVLIVQTASSVAEHQDTVVIGDDLMILLCKHAPRVGNKLYFRPDQNRIPGLHPVVEI